MSLRVKTADGDIVVADVGGGGGGKAPTADDVSYNNAVSGLEAEDVQDAITEVNTKAESKIASPATAEVGQVLIVKAVDDSGKPSEWETVDMGSRYTMTLDSETATLNINLLGGDTG